MNIEIAYRPSIGVAIVEGFFTFFPALGAMFFAVDMADSSWSRRNNGDTILTCSLISVILFSIGIWRIYQFSSYRKKGKVILLDEKQFRVPHKNDEEVDVIQLSDIKKVNWEGYGFSISTLNETYSMDPSWISDSKKYTKLLNFLKSLAKENS